jgi:hypothetical protein
MYCIYSLCMYIYIHTCTYTIYQIVVIRADICFSPSRRRNTYTEETHYICTIQLLRIERKQAGDTRMSVSLLELGGSRVYVSIFSNLRLFQQRTSFCSHSKPRRQRRVSCLSILSMQTYVRVGALPLGIVARATARQIYGSIHLQR